MRTDANKDKDIDQNHLACFAATMTMMMTFVQSGRRGLLSASRWSNGSIHHRQLSSFTFAGARKLDDIIKKEMLADKSASEISDLWTAYHESKENVHGVVMDGSKGSSILKRAKDCPFFIQPVFREDGFFMLLSQFQDPSYFLMAYLEDYKTDPTNASPLLTLSIFDDFEQEHDLTLVRCDVVNRGISDEEGLKVMQHVLDSYTNEEGYLSVHAFNKTPDTFDADDYISQQNHKWKADGTD